MPFHLSLLAVLSVGHGGNHWLSISILSPAKLLKKIAPQCLHELALLNVKFSKTLILFFFTDEF